MWPNYEASSASRKQLDYITSKGHSQPKLFYDSLDRNNSYWKLQTAYLIYPLVMELIDQPRTDGFKKQIDQSGTDGFKKQYMHLQRSEIINLYYEGQINLISIPMLKKCWNERMGVEKEK